MIGVSGQFEMRMQRTMPRASGLDDGGEFHLRVDVCLSRMLTSRHWRAASLQDAAAQVRRCWGSNKRAVFTSASAMWE